jgi:hypothetical protein
MIRQKMAPAEIGGVGAAGSEATLDRYIWLDRNIGSPRVVLVLCRDRGVIAFALEMQAASAVSDSETIEPKIFLVSLELFPSWARAEVAAARGPGRLGEPPSERVSRHLLHAQEHLIIHYVIYRL